MESKIQNTQIISSDFFDTLFVRNVCNPRDVFYLLEEEIKSDWNISSSFSEERNKAIEKSDKTIPLMSYIERYRKIPDYHMKQCRRLRKKKFVWKREF